MVAVNSEGGGIGFVSDRELSLDGSDTMLKLLTSIKLRGRRNF